MNEKNLAKEIYHLTEDKIYQILDKFKENQTVDKSLVYCFLKAFYLHIVKLYSTKFNIDFEKLYLEYKENLKIYYRTNNPNIENELLQQILNFFDNSFGLIESVEFQNIEDSYEFRHYTINVFELLRMILEKKSKATIRENIFDKDIRIIIEESEKVLGYIKK